MANSTLLQILSSREDISDYLFHFTKGINAYDTLIQILGDSKLIDVNKKGYICFTEAPLTALYNMFQIFERFENPMYAPYGIGFKKNTLYNVGCRPVIYGTNKDFGYIHKELYWRCVEYIPEIKDYSWLREWRLPQKCFTFNPDDVIVFTKTIGEAHILMEITEDPFDFDGDVDDGEFHGYVTAELRKQYKTISMEDIRSVCMLDKEELNTLILSQNIGVTETINLGNF